MSGGKYFEWILVYFSLVVGVYSKKSFISHNKNLSPLCASEIVIFNINFYSKRDDSVYDASYRYSNLSPPTVNMTLNGSDFIGR